MRVVILLSIALLGTATAEFCLNEMSNACLSSSPDKIETCNAKYSAAHTVMPDLHSYVRQHIDHSFQYLLMSTNFANYAKNRDGFAKLFKKLSDTTWDDAIDLIKYISKRGGTMNFEAPLLEEPNSAFRGQFEFSELKSLSRGLDMYKSLGERAHSIHSEVTKRSAGFHDAETLNFLENKFVKQHSDVIRDLAGHTNDLSTLIKGHPSDPSLAIYLFDEYLQKIL